MAAHPITDHLLNAMVGIKSAVGVSPSAIAAAMDAVGARRDTPEGREELLAALAELMPEPGSVPAEATPLSASELWRPRISEDLQAHRSSGFGVDSASEDRGAEFAGDAARPRQRWIGSIWSTCPRISSCCSRNSVPPTRSRNSIGRGRLPSSLKRLRRHATGWSCS
jgi:hypothetical protein